MTASAWPPLPLGPWEPAKETLHRYCRVVGKVRMALEPPRNHWWHVPLYVATRGLTTGPMPAGGMSVEVLLDFVDHEAVVFDSVGGRTAFALRDGLAVAGFHEALFAALRAYDEAGAIDAAADDLGDDEPLSQDRVHHTYDPEAVTRFWTVLRGTDRAFRLLGSDFLGKTSPVHLFWHSFDLAVTRFSGRKAPLPGGPDGGTAPAHAHETTNFGFWPGDAHVREPAFYAYAWPEPDGLAASPLRPAGARWTRRADGSALALLPYEAVRTTADPAQGVVAFCRGVHAAAAALAGWDVDALAATPADWTD